MEEQREIPKEIKEQIEKAKKSGTWESHYLLTLWSVSRSGSAFDEREDFEVLYGEIELVKMYTCTDQYGRATKYLVIPKELGTIIRSWRDYSDINNNTEKYQLIFVFTQEGWKGMNI